MEVEMKNKKFMKVMLLSASLITCYGNAFAQAGEVIDEFVHEESQIKGVIFENINRATQKRTIGFRAELLTPGEKFKNSPRSLRRIPVLRLGFNGVRVHPTDAALNANLTKAISSDILKGSYVEDLNKMVLKINPTIITREGEVVKRSATFSFDVPSLSNFNLNALNSTNRSPYERVEVTISDASAAYNVVKKKIEVRARVKGVLKYASWYIRNLVSACARSTPMGTTRDCNAYVNNLISGDNMARCSVLIGFALQENGVIRTANLAPKIGYTSPTSSKVVVMMAGSASGQPLCADGQERQAIFSIEADENGRGKSDTAGILPDDYFDENGEAHFELHAAARIPDPFYSKINRLTLAEGPSQSITFAKPAEIN